MPTYLFTDHAYGTWMPDHPRGYTVRGGQVLPPDPEMAAHYHANAEHPPVAFDDGMQWVMVQAVRDVCAKYGWRLHCVATVKTHVHYLVTWDDRSISWARVRDRMKQVMGYRLAQLRGTKDRRYFVRGDDATRVERDSHFEYLMTTYLPDHRGAGWSEREPSKPTR
ncbi:MAG TPA: hypothetical protein VK324_01905 [Tepidisphaeraceae bacterium]|nr:hypothetical protein [Tepidisphaeraceae bacterium]